MEKSTSEKLKALSNKITKMDMYKACIDFAKNQVPVDIATIKAYLNGVVRDEEFGQELLQYFTERISVAA